MTRDTQARQTEWDPDPGTFDHHLSAWIDVAEVEYQRARERGYPAVADIFRRAKEDLLDLIGLDR